MKHRTMGVLAGIVVIGTGIAGTACWRGAESTVEEPQMFLRTYQVPAGFEDEARQMLRNAMQIGDKAQGSVSVGPSGTVLVVAPPTIQTGVQAFLEQLKQVAPQARGPQPVALDCWFLVGRRAGTGRQAPPGVPRREGPGFTVLGSDSVPALDAPLGQIATQQGPTEFTLLEHLRVTSVGDDLATNNGRGAAVRQRAAPAGPDIVAEIRLNVLRTQHELTTRVVLKRGQMLVLAESGFAGETPEVFAGTRTDDLTLYYVVAADLPA